MQREKRQQHKQHKRLYDLLISARILKVFALAYFVFASLPW